MGEAQDLNTPVEDVISGFLNETLTSSIHAPGYVPPVDTSASGDPQVVTPTFVRPTSRTPPGVLTYQGEGLVDRGTLTSPLPFPPTLTPALTPVSESVRAFLLIVYHDCTTATINNHHP